MKLCKHRKKSSIAFMKYFSKIINLRNEGKCWFFYFLIETDFLDIYLYFLPTNEMFGILLMVYVALQAQSCVVLSEINIHNFWKKVKG